MKSAYTRKHQNKLLLFMLELSTSQESRKKNRNTDQNSRKLSQKKTSEERVRVQGNKIKENKVRKEKKMLETQVKVLSK